MTDRPTYWDVPENVRHALTPEQMEFYCRRELADAGYVYPTPPLVLPEKAPQVDTTTFYRPQLDRYNRLSIAFPTMEDAAAFLKLSPVEVAHAYQCDRDYSKPIAGMSIEPVELSTEVQVDSVKQALTEAHKNKDANAEARREFDKDVTKCDDLIEHVREDHRKRVSHEYNLQCIRDKFAEFLKIANDDATIATRFLLKQHDEALAIEALPSSLMFSTDKVTTAEEK